MPGALHHSPDLHHFITAIGKNGALLCLDYGEARIGIARSDPDRMYALSGETYIRRNTRKDVGYISAVLLEYRCAGLIVGRPYESDGTESELCASIDAFLLKIDKKIMLPRFFIDERMSTAAVNRVMQLAGKNRRESQRSDDAAAAALLLQNTLDLINASTDLSIDK